MDEEISRRRFDPVGLIVLFGTIIVGFGVFYLLGVLVDGVW